MLREFLRQFALWLMIGITPISTIDTLIARQGIDRSNRAVGETGEGEKTDRTDESTDSSQDKRAKDESEDEPEDVGLFGQPVAPLVLGERGPLEVQTHVSLTTRANCLAPIGAVIFVVYDRIRSTGPVEIRSCISMSTLARDDQAHSPPVVI